MTEKNETYEMLVRRAEESKARVKKAQEHLDNALQTETLPYNARMCLIEMLSAVRHQALTEELLAIEFEHVHRRIDNVIKHITGK